MVAGQTLFHASGASAVVLPNRAAQAAAHHGDHSQQVVYQYLVDRSDREGRSLSNLVAFLLETDLSAPGRPPL